MTEPQPDIGTPVGRHTLDNVGRGVGVLYNGSQVGVLVGIGVDVTVGVSVCA